MCDPNKWNSCGFLTEDNDDQMGTMDDLIGKVTVEERWVVFECSGRLVVVVAVALDTGKHGNIKYMHRNYLTSGQ